MLAEIVLLGNTQVQVILAVSIAKPGGGVRVGVKRVRRALQGSITPNPVSQVHQTVSIVHRAGMHHPAPLRVPSAGSANI